MAIGHLADRLRLRGCPFPPGLTLDFGEPISDESAMTAFVLYASTLTEMNRRVDVTQPPAV